MKAHRGYLRYVNMNEDIFSAAYKYQELTSKSTQEIMDVAEVN